MGMKQITFFIICIFIAGCASAQQKKEERAALKSVAEAVSGQEMTDQDVRRLERQIKNDPEAQSAVKAITDSVQGSGKVVAKYSPVTGKRYSPHLEYEPGTGARLLPVSE